MRHHTTHAFATQLFVCLIVCCGFGGVLAVGVVWQRHQITVTAKAHRSNQAKLEEIRRKLDAVATLVETEQGYAVLTSRNESMHLGLAPATDAQVVRVTEDPVTRLARRRDAGLFNDGFAPLTFRVAAQNN